MAKRGKMSNGRNISFSTLIVNRRVFRISIRGGVGGRYNIIFDGPFDLIIKVIKVMNDNKIASFLKLKI